VQGDAGHHSYIIRWWTRKGYVHKWKKTPWFLASFIFQYLHAIYIEKLTLHLSEKEQYYSLQALLVLL
jgi:maltodextrin utilization protein YvdJ